ncbi:MAG: hypothetical protein AB7E47_12265 [Desulfovibrionaceae bacterium]
MLLFDVPIIPDEGYVSFLRQRQARLHAVHFGLAAPGVPDARRCLEPDGPGGVDAVARALAAVPAPRKYALLNSRFHHPDRYGDAAFLGGLADTLERLQGDGLLHGIVFADCYLLAALAAARPELAARLEAVPSVNCMLDSGPKAVAMLRHVAQLGFCAPSKVILDRSLNRDLEGLDRAVAMVRAEHPGACITLLANEGCLLHCPFKPAHDAHIALAHLDGSGVACGMPLHRELGCMRAFYRQREYLCSAPFIRPEDVARYEGRADVVKICGRTRGGAFLTRAVAAYMDGRFAGNLLELNDATEPLAQRLWLDNAALPPDFWDMVTRCDKRCASCGVCARLAAAHVREVSAMPPEPAVFTACRK